MSETRQGKMWLTLIQYRISPAAILRRLKPVLFIAFCCVVTIPAFAANVSYQVNQVIKPGNIDITYTDPATNKEVTKTVPVINGDIGNPAMVAAKIVGKIPGSFIDPNDATKTKSSFRAI